MKDVKYRAYYKPKDDGRDWEQETVGMHEVVAIKWAEWINDGKESLLAKNLGINIKRDNGGHLWVAPHEIELLQYTGMKDKDGKDIYVGDIVKTFEGIWEVTLKNLEDGIVLVNRPDYEASMSYPEEYSLSECEVIGNIYENPELMNN